MCDYEEDTVLEVGKTYVFKSEQAKREYIANYHTNSTIIDRLYEDGFTIHAIDREGDGLSENGQYITDTKQERNCLKLKEDMSVDKHVEFTKSMLKDGMVVMLRNQDCRFSRGKMLVLGDRLLSDGNACLDYYSQDMYYEDDNDFDIMAVYSVNETEDLNIEDWGLTLLWERKEPSPEVLATHKKIDEIQSTIDTLNNQLGQLRKL